MAGVVLSGQVQVSVEGGSISVDDGNVTATVVDNGGAVERFTVTLDHEYWVTIDVPGGTQAYTVRPVDADMALLADDTWGSTALKDYEDRKYEIADADEPDNILGDDPKIVIYNMSGSNGVDVLVRVVRKDNSAGAIVVTPGTPPGA